MELRAKPSAGPSEQLTEAAACSSGDLLPSSRHPAAWLLRGFSQPPTPFCRCVSQLGKGFWHLLKLIFLTANGALSTHLGLQPPQLTVCLRCDIFAIIGKLPGFFFSFLPLLSSEPGLGAVWLFLGKCLFSSCCFHVYLGRLASNKDHMSSLGSLALFPLREDLQAWPTWRKKFRA